MVTVTYTTGCNTHLVDGLKPGEVGVSRCKGGKWKVGMAVQDVEGRFIGDDKGRAVFLGNTAAQHVIRDQTTYVGSPFPQGTLKPFEVPGKLLVNRLKPGQYGVLRKDAYAKCLIGKVFVGMDSDDLLFLEEGRVCSYHPDDEYEIVESVTINQQGVSA